MVAVEWWDYVESQRESRPVGRRKKVCVPPSGGIYDGPCLGWGASERADFASRLRFGVWSLLVAAVRAKARGDPHAERERERETRA